MVGVLVGGERSLAWASALLAAGASGMYLLLGPPGPDLAAQVYRAGLAASQGIAIWNGQWYGGHYLPGYSLLAPLAEAAVGTQLLGIIAGAVSAAAFAGLTHRHFGARASVGALWFSLALVTDLIVGRVTFSLGLALGLIALIALQRGRPRIAAGARLLCGLASPVAGVLLALSGFAVWVADRRLAGLTTSACALAPAAAMAWLFPDGGSQPFTVASFVEVMAFSVAALLLVPRRERVVRLGALLYAVTCVLAFALPTPLGGNVLRLGTLFGGPVLACVLWGRRRMLATAAGVLLLVWQWAPAVSAVAGAAGDPSTGPEYFRPLLAYLQRHARPLGRVEIPFTRNHWEAAYVAPRFPLARGWERQLDVRYNRLFYAPGLSGASYYAWLRRDGVRYVAVPDAPLDTSAKAEMALIDRRPRYLRLVYRGAHWRVFAVARPLPLAAGAGRVVSLGPSSFVLVAKRRGAVAVRVHYTPLWRVVAGSGCVEATAAGWTRVLVPDPGRVRVAIRFTPQQLVDPAPERCTPR